MNAIRNLGFKYTIPGRCIINVPVVARRNPTNPKDRRFATMYGVCRVIRIMPVDRPLIYVRPSACTQTMIDLMVRSREGRSMIALSPSLINCSFGMYVTVEPEIVAAMRHARVCGYMPGTQLDGTPCVLEQKITAIRTSIERLAAQQLYSYPSRKINDARQRYAVIDQHNRKDGQDHTLGYMPTSTDFDRISVHQKREVPDLDLLRVQSCTSVQAIIEMLVDSQTNKAAEKLTMENVLNQFKDPALLRSRLAQIGINKAHFERALANRTNSFRALRNTAIATFEIGNVAKYVRNMQMASAATLNVGSSRAAAQTDGDDLDEDVVVPTSQDDTSYPPPSPFPRPERVQRVINEDSSGFRESNYEFAPPAPALTAGAFWKSVPQAVRKPQVPERFIGRVAPAVERGDLQNLFGAGAAGGEGETRQE